MDLTVADQIRSRVQVRLDLPTPDDCRMLRTAADLTLQDIADAVGVTAHAICQYELGKRRPQGARLTRYVAAMNALKSLHTPQVAA